MTEQLDYIRIKDIVKNPYQPRLIFKQNELEELAQSIKENGLIQPIIVRKSDIIGYELIAGERRLRASQLAGLTTIPAIIKNISADDSMKQAIIENLQRQDLNPIEEAKAYQQLIIKKAMTHDEIAKSMGKSRPYITNSLRLLQLPSVILEGIEKGDVSPGHARLLLSLSDEQKQKQYYQMIISEGLSIRQLEKKLTPKQANQIKRNIFVEEYEEKIAQSLGLEVSITSNNQGKGKVTISFENLEDFNRIVDKLL
ncbi:ParB/RepB/Spo0J family partition protein [Streptococcus fryi]